MKKLTMVDGEIYLDDLPVPCVKSFKIVSSEEKSGVAELTICMDVSIGPTLPESKQ